MSHVSVVIPVYKAEKCLNELYRRLKSSLILICADFEIIMVEDCGGDRSWDVICQLCRNDNRVKGIKLSRNFGQHFAITAGLDYCNGDWIIIMDCDLQDSPEEIPRLHAKAQEGYDIVLARRIQRKDNIFKKFFSNIFYKVFNYLTEMKYDGQVGNFRIISKKVVTNFRLFREHLRLFGGLIHLLGFKTSFIDVIHEERYEGKSSYNLKKLYRLALDSIVSYSYKPLRLSVNIGFVISFFSFIYGIFIIIKALMYHTSVLGWSSLIVSIYFMGGVIIFNMGIIGIYIGKIFDETKRRPLYIIEEVANLSDQ